jgi:hypothetical protein
MPVQYRVAVADDAIAIHDFAMQMDWQWRCNPSQERPERSYPKLHQIVAYIAEARSTVWVAEDHGNLVAYLICRETGDGCQGRWYGVQPGSPAEMAEITKAMMDLAVARYGRLWGRLPNPAVHQLFAEVPGVVPNPRHPEVLIYGPDR